MAKLPAVRGDFIVWETPAFLSWSEGQQVSVSLAGPQSVPVFPVPALGLLLAFLSASGITARRRAMRVSRR